MKWKILLLIFLYGPIFASEIIQVLDKNKRQTFVISLIEKRKIEIENLKSVTFAGKAVYQENRKKEIEKKIKRIEKEILYLEKYLEK